MPGSANPLMPLPADTIWSGVMLILVALLIIAFVSLLRQARHLTLTQSLLWFLLILIVPALGPLAWLLIGRRSLAAKLQSAT